MSFATRVMIRTAAGGLIYCGMACASAIVFTGSSDDGKLSASAQFSYTAGTLELTILNTSSVASTNSNMLLTGVFFQLEDWTSMDPLSGALHGDSEFLGASGSPSSDTVGAAWRYDSWYLLSPGWVGVRSVGLEILGFGAKGNFGCGGPGNPCLTLNGPNYGVASASTTYGDLKKDMKPAINNGITLAWNAGIEPQISKVWFQYGDDLCSPGFFGAEMSQVPEPGAIVLTALGFACLVGARRLRRHV